MGYIASGSANVRMTDESIDVTVCQFSCQMGADEDRPDSIDMQIRANKVGVSDTQGAEVFVDTTVTLRSY